MKVLRSITYTLIVACLSISSLQGQKHDISFAPIVGIVHSNVRGSHHYAKSEHFPGNYWKTAYHLGVEADLKIWNNWKLLTAINFQARKPLDTFVFSYQNPDILGNPVGLFVVGNYPVTEKLRKQEGYTKEEAGVFPNFNYLYLSACPSFEFGKTIKLQVGAGGFYGILLNRTDTEVGVEDVKLFTNLLQSRNPFIAPNRYNRFDGGVKGHIRAILPVQSSLQFFLDGSYWLSLTPMNEFYLGHLRNIKQSAYVLSFGVAVKMQE